MGLNLLIGVVIGIRARQRYPCELELRMLGSSIRPMGWNAAAWESLSSSLCSRRESVSVLQYYLLVFSLGL